MFYFGGNELIVLDGDVFCKTAKRRGTKKTQRLSSQVPHKLGEIDKLIKVSMVKLCRTQDVLSQSDV